MGCSSQGKFSASVALVSLLFVPTWALAQLSGGFLFVEAQTDGAGGVKGLGGASSVTVSADGLHVYSTGTQADAVDAFSRNPLTGGLTFVQTQTDGLNGVDGLNGASDVVVSPDGLNVYVTGANDNALAVFSRNLVSGALTFV